MMQEIINWLNNNQGVVSAISCVIAVLVNIIGFTVVNSNIKIINKQSVKNVGDNNLIKQNNNIAKGE